MIKAGFIAGGTKSSIDELYAEMSFSSNDYGSTVDEIFAEVAIGAPEYGSTVDELYAETAFGDFYPDLLIDDIGIMPAAAYSLRQLRKDYYGSAIRVRRSNDNAEQNIGFCCNGNLDTVALLAFVGANTGYVTTVYAQISGSGNLIQPTAVNQPRVVDAGTLVTLPGSTRPAIRSGAGFDRWLYSDTGLAAGLTAMTLNVVGAFSALGGYKMLAGGANVELGATPNNFSYFGTAGVASSTGIAISTNQGLILSGTVTSTSNPAPNWLNGTASSTELTMALSTSRVTTALGSRGSLALVSAVIPNGWWAEHVVASSVLSTEYRQKLERHQGRYYGITVA